MSRQSRASPSALLYRGNIVEIAKVLLKAPTLLLPQTDLILKLVRAYVASRICQGLTKV